MAPKLVATTGSAVLVTTADGIAEGVADAASGLCIFRGIPFAAPPVGDLRWKPPRPAAAWDGVRGADRFGPRAMQLPVFGDMNFRSDGMSEDCLYLNVWTPATSDQARLPVLIYFYGGGNVGGDGSEPRYDGAQLARRGLVVLTANYRLNAFGFLAHPQLTEESPNRTSGNYGYLDQIAALRWVRTNIAAFGGDPERVTIAGESAGSIAVSALMVSPLAKDLFSSAIGSSGSIMGALPPVPLAQAEQNGVAFAASVGATSLAELRAVPAERVLQATQDLGPPRFTATLDGHFLPRLPADIFAAGAQARVPLLVGWNSEEAPYTWLLGAQTPTEDNYRRAVRARYGDDADALLELYPAASPKEVEEAATTLASDSFIGYSTWKWADLHGRTGGAPVYRYIYAHPRPPMRPEMGNAVAGLAGGVIRGPEAEAQQRPPARGAVHSADIEYFMGNLATNTVYAWTEADYALSERMQAYYANFVKTGDPNGAGLPVWPPANAGDTVQVMRLDVESAVDPEQHRRRYLLLDKHFAVA
jgi:para-nitrobenzyl esterase